MLKRLEISMTPIKVDNAGNYRETWFLDIIERSSLTGYETASNICSGTREYCLGQKDLFVKENPGTLFRLIQD